MPRDFVANSVFARPHALKLASLTFKNFMRGQLLATLRYKSDACGTQNEAYLYWSTTLLRSSVAAPAII